MHVILMQMFLPSKLACKELELKAFSQFLCFNIAIYRNHSRRVKGYKLIFCCCCGRGPASSRPLVCACLYMYHVPCYHKPAAVLYTLLRSNNYLMLHLLQPNVHIPTGKHGSSLGNKGRHPCLCEWLQKYHFLSHLLSSLPLVSDSISKLFSSTACHSCSDNLKETRGGEGKEGKKDGKEGKRRRE